jgi:phosphoribosylglycinamide formyltransferase-1
MSGGKYSICVLASGNGSTLKSIIDACRTGYISGRVVEMITDNPLAFAIRRAESEGIPVTVIDRRRMRREEFDASLHSRLTILKPDLICLAGYLRILSHETVSAFPMRILNIHPSLLPRYGGKGMYGLRVHKAVIEAGEKISGCTVHFVTDDVDGGPAIVQRKVPVLPGDTPETLMQRVHAEELVAYPTAIKMVMEESFTPP